MFPMDKAAREKPEAYVYNRKYTWGRAASKFSGLEGSLVPVFSAKERKRRTAKSPTANQNPKPFQCLKS